MLFLTSRRTTHAASGDIFVRGFVVFNLLSQQAETPPSNKVMSALKMEGRDWHINIPAVLLPWQHVLNRTESSAHRRDSDEGSF